MAKTGVAPVRIAATRHRPRNQLSRGSLTTSSGCWSKCGSSHSLTRMRAGSRLQILPVSNHALGRESLTCTSASGSHSSWTSTTHCGSLKPRGLESSGGTSGSGTCMPSLDTMPASVLVPLRPAPATKRTFRGTPSGFISSIALACSVTAGSLPATLPRSPALGSGTVKRLFSRAPLLGVVIPAWGVEDYLDDCVRSLLAQTHRRWEAVDRRRRLDRPHRRDRRRVGAPRQPDQRHPLRQRRARRRAQPRHAARAGRLPRLPRLRRRPPAHGVRRPRGRPRGVGLRLRDRLDRALGGGRPGRAAVDAPAPPTAPWRADRRPARDPRRRVRVEQGLAAGVLGRRGARVAGGRALRGPADDDAVVPARVVRRARRGRLPLADPRGLDHPDPRLVGAGPRRPLGDQAAVARVGAGLRLGRGRGGLRRPGAGR